MPNISSFFIPILLTGMTTLSACSKTETSEASSNENVAEAKTENTVSTSDVFSNEKVLQSLVNFDSTEQKAWIESTTARHTLADTGRQNTVMQAYFSAEEGISKISIKPETPWQINAEKKVNLAFDVSNLGDDTAQLYLSIENLQGNYQSRSVALEKGFSGTVYFPVTGIEAETETGLWGEAPPWSTSNVLMIWRSWRKDWGPAEGISRLNFFTIGAQSPKKLSIDNIRLRENPTTDKNWMVGVIDRFGQYSRTKTTLSVSNEAELKALADKELAALKHSTGIPNRSKFGGYTGAPKREATGYFRTEKIDGKWWMVDPEGYLFFSHGPANVRMANLSTITGIDYKDESVRKRSDDETTPEDSMGIVNISETARKTRYVNSKLRNEMFQWLPEYDSELADHYSYRRSTHKGPVPHGETYSFYRANLERRYGADFMKKWYDVTVQRMKHWGFTSFGNWVDPAFYDIEKTPYFANGWIIGNYKTLSGEKNHWGLMPDPFDSVFAERAEATISLIAKDVKASPWCVGIFIDNEKSWGAREGSVPARYGLILDALSKNAQESPAKNAFSQKLQSKYSNINALNKAWNTQIKNWAVFNTGVEFNEFSEQQVADLSMLLEELGKQYFEVVHGTLGRFLPNHLYMGARMANWGMPDEVIKASIKYSDVLSFNIYEDSMQETQWKFLEKVDLPVVIGEFHFGTATDAGMFNPGIVHAANQKDRAHRYRVYMDSILDKPYMVGAHWFQYVDEPVSGRALDGENANIGFVTVADVPYPELIEAVQDFTGNMYQRRLEQPK